MNEKIKQAIRTFRKSDDDKITPSGSMRNGREIVMQFTVAGSRITCSRLDNTVEDEDIYRRVVELDANVDKVPPHVAARLTSGEVQQLVEFLADRQRIRDNSADRNMLEALPGLLREASEILDSVDSVKKGMYEQLSLSIDDVREALEKVSPEESATE